MCNRKFLIPALVATLVFTRPSFPAEGVSSPLTSALLAGDTVAQLTNAANIPQGALVTFGSELTQVCSVSGNTITFGTPAACPSISGRGLSGTTAASHGAGTIAYLNITAPYSEAPNVVTPQFYGARGNGKVLNCGAMTSGSAVLTCAEANFTSADPGKLIDVNGAGAPGCGTQYINLPATMNCNLVTTIRSRQSPSQITLNAKAGTTVTGKQIVYGTDDHAAIASAIASGAGAVYFPAANYINGSQIHVVAANQALTGAGMNASVIWSVGPVAYSGSTTYESLFLDNGSHDVTLTDLGFKGTNAKGELTAIAGRTADGILLCTGYPKGNGTCNASSGISNIKFTRVQTSNLWGIGLHIPGSGTKAGQRVTGITLVDGMASYNSADGLNPNSYDLIVSGYQCQYNGTGGLEASTYDSTVISGNIIDYNRLGGASLGGFVGGDNGRNLNIIGGEFSYNGLGQNLNGQGLIITTNTNFAVSGIVAIRNAGIGIELVATPGSGHGIISGSYIADNGATGNSSAYGIYNQNMSDITMAANRIVNTAPTGFAQAAGIILGSSTDKTQMRGNHVSGHTLGADYELAGTNLLFADPDNTSTLTIDTGTNFLWPQPQAATARVPVLPINSNAITPVSLVNQIGAGLIKTINLPKGMGEGQCFTAIPTGAYTYDSSSNILRTGTAVVGRQMSFCYVNGSWSPSY